MSMIRELVKRATRSSGWTALRNKHVADNPACAACGSLKSPECHHIRDFSTHPELELDPDNLITLCGKRCHFFVGHLLDWRSINPDVVEISAWILEKIKQRRR